MKVLKEIKSKTGELVFRRYHLFTTPWFHCWLHEWHRADEDRHMHSHPWNFFGIILKGGYIEETLDGEFKRSPGSIIKGKYHHVHKVKKLLAPKGYTLFFAGKKTYGWGFRKDYPDGSYSMIPNEEYRKRKREGSL